MTTPQNNRPVTAVLGTKLGMTQLWDEAGRLVPVTVVAVGTNVVTQVRSAETDGYTAVQLAYGQIDPRKVTKPVAGHYKKADVTPRRHLVELRTDAVADYVVEAVRMVARDGWRMLGEQIGDRIDADGFVVFEDARADAGGDAAIIAVEPYPHAEIVLDGLPVFRPCGIAGVEALAHIIGR